MKMIKKTNRMYPNFDSMIDHLFSDPIMNSPLGGISSFNTGTPVYNMLEDKDSWTIELAIPGLEKEDIHVDIDNGVLSISYDHSEKASDSEQNYRVQQFKQHSFTRTFKLKEGQVNEDLIQATYKAGVLTLTLPKREEVKPQPKKLIEVS